jgi:hypothetical protein
VVWRAGSDPALGSVSENAPIISPDAKRVKNFSFCFSVPYFKTLSHTMELCTDITTAVDAQA